MKERNLYQELKDHTDIDDAWKADTVPGEPIPWEALKTMANREYKNLIQINFSFQGI